MIHTAFTVQSSYQMYLRVYKHTNVHEYKRFLLYLHESRKRGHRGNSCDSMYTGRAAAEM